MALEFKKKPMTPKDFFGKLFQTRDQMHLAHLAVKGIGAYAAHKALNNFYDEVLDLTDSIIEEYQGKYGIQDITIPASTKEDAIVALKALVKLTDGGEAYNMFKESSIKNKIDELTSLIYETLYKLENLK